MRQWTNGEPGNKNEQYSTAVALMPSYNTLFWYKLDLSFKTL